MYNKNSNTFENYYLNMYDSIENNVNFRDKYPATNPVNTQVIGANNAWLNCGESVDKVLGKLILQGKLVERQAGDLNRYGLLSQQMQGLVERFQILGEKLAQQSGSQKRQEVCDEYQQLADHIMPTLARINQRVEARREAVGIKADAQISVPPADETLDVALRAAQKRRA